MPIGDRTINTIEIMERLIDLEDRHEEQQTSRAENRELALLKECVARIEATPDMETAFVRSVTLIREDQFENYVRELLADCGDIPENFPKYIHIDWARTAATMRSDYVEVDVAGHRYLARA